MAGSLASLDSRASALGGSGRWLKGSSLWNLYCVADTLDEAVERNYKNNALAGHSRCIETYLYLRFECPFTEDPFFLVVFGLCRIEHV